MRTEEQAVANAFRLYEVRRTVRSLLGDRFKPKMAEFGKAIDAVCVGKKVDSMSAAILLAKAAQAEGRDMEAMLFMAAVVEATDPSPELAHG
jgi:hypothetical protein